MNIRIKNHLTLEQAPPPLKVKLKEILTMLNPRWLENERQGYWNGKTARLIKCFAYDKLSDTVTIPRGFLPNLMALCNHDSIPFSIDDQTRIFPELSFNFNGGLRPLQVEPGATILKNRFGVLSAPTGSGKTVVALWAIAQRKQPTQIIVHTKDLQNQWAKRITQFLGIPPVDIGFIGGGKFKIKPVTVAIVNSLYKRAADVAVNFGFLIVDECHKTPARTFTEAVTGFDSRYMLGLSATPWRRDKLDKLIKWHLGDIVFNVEKKALIKSGDILTADVIVRPTGFRPKADPSEEYSQMLSELTKDYDRNKLIAGDVALGSKYGGCIVLSDRKPHCHAIKNILKDEYGVESQVLTGDTKNKERLRIVEEVQAGLIKVLIATGQLIGEGFDCASLSTLFLATPIKFDGRVIQYIGRILRPAEGKQPTIYDYVDPVGVLINGHKARKKAFRDCGCTIMVQ